VKRNATKKSKRLLLVSTRVSEDVKQKLTKLCTATKRTEANYVAALLEAHVDVVTPKQAASLHRSWTAIKGIG
jgi:predicted DNA-binding protein